MKNILFIFIKKCFFIVFICFLVCFFSYSSSLEKLNGIAIIIGDEIILDSEIRNNDEKESLCHTNGNINDFIIKKLILFHAKKDESIQISDQELEYMSQVFLSEIKNKYINQEQFLIQLKDKEFLKKLNENIKNQQYIEKFYKKITDDVEVTPEEIKYFFTQKKNQIPFTPKKMCISYIILYPKLSNIDKKKIIDFLNQIKKEILYFDNDFSTKAILFSEDDSSALQGGLIKGMKIKNLPEQFQHSISFLKEGEISEPFETNLGFHLIKLENKNKDEIDFRQILIKPKYSKYELYKAKSFAKLFRKRISNHKINLDKIPDLLNHNEIVDVIVQNKIWIEENQLSKNMKKVLLSLKKGKITNPYKEIINGKEAFVMIKLLDDIPSKPYSLEENYTTLKNLLTSIKKKEKIKNWAKDILKKTYYVKINC
ncbi:peptidylprolyl isomerase [Blattabacterium cuenoti]|uniref:peptidylprolyl isomerase n=1 Tax=Blattabacterium cuenoti TaxID=1653831 RepID=UPI00163CEB04|nr:peptidylprolyl isomerase [Blattabacterium cuenoti]